MDKRIILAGAAVLLATAPAPAEFKPSKPIEMVIHNGPGTGPDVFGRQVITTIEQEKLSPVRIQVANRVGGGGTTAASYMMSKKGDAHTLAVFTSVWVTNPLVQEAAKDKLRDMTPLSRLVLEPALIVVKAEAPFKTLQDYVEAAKKPSSNLKQAGGSVYSRDALVRFLLMAKTGARWTYISFPTNGERTAALLGGHVDMLVIDPSEAGELIRSGKLRAIAQVSEKRLKGFENIPTIPEAGFAIPNVPQARGILGPPDMPADAIAFYEDLLQKTVKSPTWQKFVTDNQLEDAFLNTKDTQAFLGTYETELRNILQQTGVKLAR